MPSLGVILAAFRQRLLVVPDVPRRSRAVEEQEVGRDAGIGREHAVGQAHDGMQVDPFDLLCHFAFNAPLRTRRERAQRLRTERKDYW